VADDAGVYRLEKNLALVQTVDFFTPVVDDPYDYGQISVTNALSDIYAMGGRPLTALNIVCFPVGSYSNEILSEILRGGNDKAQEAEVVIIGGHSVEDLEPKYGLAVTGVINPEKVVTKATAKPGDVLILTKPLGIGILTTALKRELVPDKLIKAITESMKLLNRGASEAMMEVGVNACTDVTGFGLTGHLYEMISTSNVGAIIKLSAMPVFEEVWEFARLGTIPGGTKANHRYLVSHVIYAEYMTLEEQLVLCDAQTSGGLLISVPKDKADLLLEKLKAKGVADPGVIGEIVEKPRLIKVEK